MCQVTLPFSKYCVLCNSVSVITCLFTSAIGIKKKKKNGHFYSAPTANEHNVLHDNHARKKKSEVKLQGTEREKAGGGGGGQGTTNTSDRIHN